MFAFLELLGDGAVQFVTVMTRHMHSVSFFDGFVKTDYISSVEGHFRQLLRTCHDTVYQFSNTDCASYLQYDVSLFDSTHW